MIRWIGCILWVGSLLLATHLHAGETITWFQPDFPPYVILDGPEKEKGIDNQTVQYVIDGLPEYTHRFQIASYRRILKNLKNGFKGVVTPLFITPERQQYLVYTNVASYLPLSNGFVINKGDLDRFKPYLSAEGSIDVDAVISSNRFSIGIASGRSYFGILDDMIRKYRHSPTFYERSGTAHMGIFRMLDSRRVDAAFGFPVEVQYLSKKMGLQNDLVVIPVQHMVPYSPVFFAAPKNPWGQQIIKKINRLISKNGVIRQFNNYYEFWLDDENLRYYRRYKQQHYNRSVP